jgi:hypothetical protein
VYHPTADSASETISITDSDAFGALALTTRSYCELTSFNSSPPERRPQAAAPDATSSVQARGIVAGAMSFAGWGPGIEMLAQVSPRCSTDGRSRRRGSGSNDDSATAAIEPVARRGNHQRAAGDRVHDDQLGLDV